MDFLIYFILTTLTFLVIGLQLYFDADVNHWRDTPFIVERKKSKYLNKILFLIVAWIIIEEIGARLFL